MFVNFKADIRRYMDALPGAGRIYIIFEQGLWAIAVYRFGHWAHGVRVPVVSLALKIIAFLFFKSIEMSAGISLPASCRIGRGVYIGHFGGIILHSDVQMGEGCSIGPGVLIGTRGMGKKGVPRLGHNVYVGVGAKILGNITIGNNVRIGANAVVLTDVPDNATVVGIPGRIIEAK